MKDTLQDKLDLIEELIRYHKILAKQEKEEGVTEEYLIDLATAEGLSIALDILTSDTHYNKIR